MNDNRPPRRLLAAAVFFVGIATLLTPLRRELYVGDETKYSQVVREMRAGSFFVPTLNGTPFTHKPPVHFWLIDVLTYPFGVYSIWPFVIPSLLAFALLLRLMWKHEGPLAAFVCGTCLMIWASAQTARMDLSFTLLIAFAAFRIRKFFDEDDFRALLVAAIALAVALLIKGPMSLVIGLCLFAFEWLRRRRRPRGNYLPSLSALIVIPLLWLVPTILVAGEAYWNEVFYKQTVGRAVGAWVHKSPPWFYLTHAPGDTAPWFLLLVVAIIAAYKRSDETAKFGVSWLLAVLVPYSILSSKLDVYMMALLPPVALVIARFVSGAEDRWTRWGLNANRVMLAILLILGVAGMVVLKPEMLKEDAAVVPLPLVKGLFAVLAAAALAGLVFGRKLLTSTLAVGLVPVVMFVYLALALVPTANEMASTRPLVRALLKQQVPPEQIALHASPHVWVRGMPRDLERVRHIDPPDLRTWQPTVIVTRRKDAQSLSATLPAYRKVDEFRMIGKWFDVYRK
ncbi:MAG TPA: glycosyltransferase family 39 protein [Thermoanaerobaculia bacterium]